MARMGGLSEAVRKALEAHGIDAKSDEVKAYINREYPDLKAKVASSTFSSTLSNEKKKMREKGDAAPAPAPVLTQPGLTKQTANGAEFADFMKALSLVKQAAGLVGKERAKQIMDEL